MREELGSTYKYKFELIRILVLRLIHFALKLQPPEYAITKPRNAAQRIANLFMELLDRQFPLNEQNTKMYFRTPAEYSRQLNIHINYLNRVVKQTTGRTTSQIISDRILQEAKLMLKNNQHSVAEIAYSLGFAEASHFSNFFRKHQHTTPSKFRESI